MPTPDEAGRQSTRPRRANAPAQMLGGARGEILSALCGKRLTAVELADRFSITSTAVRAHLNELRSSGLVRYRTEVRGVGKPTHVYELTPEGQYLLSSAYVPVLVNLLHTVDAHLGDSAIDVIRDAGRSLAEASVSPARRQSLRARAEQCAELLRSLGGSASVEEIGGELIIRSECCPLAATVAQMPTACKLFEGMARAVTARAVEEHCDRSEQPHCVFRIPRT